MSNDWTIDTYVLYKAAELDGDALEFLNKILRLRKVVCFDDEGEIEKEYKKCFKKLKRSNVDCRFLNKWFVDIVGRSAQKYSGKIDRRDRIQFESLHFHNDDWVFVVVCSKSNDKRLVAEDSDYNTQVKNYLESKLEVNVVSISEALNI